MFVVAVAAGAVLTLIVGLLAIPMVVVVDVDATSRVRWRVNWLYGWLTLQSDANKAAPPAPASSSAPTRSPATGNRSRPVARRKGSGRTGLAVLRTRGLFSRVTRLVVSLLKRARVERLHLDAAFGFENPADTGVVFGGLSPMLVFAQARGWDVHCRPMFREDGVRGSFGATLRIRPLHVVGTVGAFMMSPPVLRAIRAAWHTRS